jgi:heat shock protein HtpX
MRKDRIYSFRTMNLLHTALLIGGMSALAAGLGWSLLGLNGLLGVVVLAALFVLLAPRVSPRLLLRVFEAEPLQENQAPWLHHVVNELSRRADLREPPQLYYAPSDMMNAFSLGRSGDAALVVTGGLLQGLNRRELTGVLAHEMTHIQHNDLRVMTLANIIGRITGLVALLGQILFIINLPLLLVGQATISWLIIVPLVAAPFVSTALQLALSRTREFGADVGAVQLTGDASGLASALWKMMEQECAAGTGLFGRRRSGEGSFLRTHPNTRRRVERLLELDGVNGSVALPEDPCAPSVRRPLARGSSGWHTSGA